MYRPSGSGRQDVKARTMKFAALDPDIASKYEDLDEEEGAAYHYKTTRMPNRDPRTGPRDQRFGGRSSQLLPKKMIGLIENHINKKDQSMMRTAGAGSSRRDMINSITVKNASRSGKDHILKLLANSVDQFLPFMTKIDENGDLSFLITNEDDAQAVCAMSKRIADKHNPSMKYAIYKRRIPAPYDMLNAASRQVIEEILKSRFNQFANSLDLSNFQNDPIFDKKRETPRGIFHNNVMVAVANLVARYYSGIRGIRLNNNNLRSLDFVSCLVYAAPNVVELDLANNAFSRIDELGKLSGWQLESVHFENNEFTTSFGDSFVAYTNAVHQYFPRVSYLDGIQVHVAADASTSESTSLALPKYKPGYYTDDSIRKMAENFLLEYFGFYDGPNGEQTRQQLINAYDPNSTFSYAACMLPDTRYVERQEDFHQQYIRNSHNIITQQKWQSFRDRLIFRGPMDIAVALSKLPPSEHVKQSFLLDFNLVSNNLMMLTLQGIFRDGKDNIGGETSGSKFKFFVRQFAIVPKAEGYRLAILSDMLQITPVSTQRMEHYNNLLKNAATQQMSQLQMDGMAPPPPSPQTHPEALLLSSSTSIKQEASSSSSLWSTPPPNNNPNDPAFRAELVKQFCLFTGMRPEWSEKCLQDCAWNWEDARAAFGCIRGKIPPEAFAS